MEEEQKVALPKRKLLFSKYSLVFLGLVVLVLLGEGIYWFRLGKKKEQQEVSPTSSPEVQTFLPIPIAHPPGTFFSPIAKENLGTGKIVNLNYKVDDLAFSLLEGELIYAAFPGRVEVAGNVDDPQKVIMLYGKENDLNWKYIFSGTAIVKNDQEVKEGDVLAKASQTPLPTRDVNLIIQALWQGKRVGMGENMLTDFANQ